MEGRYLQEEIIPVYSIPVWLSTSPNLLVTTIARAHRGM
jgi:hypothetical protein